jgi:hypothetical protein
MNKLDLAGYGATHRIAAAKWINRQINSPREMMLWFGHDVVSMHCGPKFHCQVTEKRLARIPRKPNHANIIFITDARMHEESKYFVDKFPLAFPVLIDRTNSSSDDHPVERSVDEFPAGYFFHTLKNDGALEELPEKVKQMLLAVKNEVTRRMENK